MIKPTIFFPAAILAAVLPAPAFGQASIEILIAHVDADADGGAQVDIRLLNAGSIAAAASLPDTVEARIERPGASAAV